MVLAATLVIVFSTSESLSARLVAAVSLTAIVPLYILIGRPAIAADRDTRRGTIYVVCMVALIVIAQTQVGAASWVMFAACPQCFMAMSLPRAFAGVVALNTTPVALGVESVRRNPGSIAFVLGTVVLGLAFSVVFGTWVARIIEQSRERAQLIERLEAAQAELAEVSRQAGTLAERQRLAGEIHDTLAQGLTSIVMLLQAADTEIGPDPAEARRHVGLATQTAREGLAEARAMVAALTPAHLDTGRCTRRSAGSPTGSGRNSPSRPGSRCAARPGRCRPTPRWCCCGPPRRRSPTSASTPVRPTSGWSCPMSRTPSGSTSVTTVPVSTPTG